MDEDYGLGVLRRAHITAAPFSARIRSRSRLKPERYIVVDTATPGKSRRAALEPQSKGNKPGFDIILEPISSGYFCRLSLSSLFEMEHGLGAWVTLDSSTGAIESASALAIINTFACDLEPQSEGTRWLDNKLTQAVLEVEAQSPHKIPYARVTWIGFDDPPDQLDPQADIARAPEPPKLSSADFPGEFVPSSELVEFWCRGLEAHRAEARRGIQSDQHLELLRRQTKEELARSFTVRIRRMFSILGNRHRHGIEDYQTIAFAKRFALEVQYQILDRVQIRPDESTEFFAKLYSELSNYLSRGGRLAGNWGRLILRGDMIEIVTEPDRLDTEGQWEQAKVLE